MTKDEALYQCHYCNKKYKTETRFLQHRCKMMDREEALRTPEGQAAWSYYQDWLRLQHRRVPDDRAFLKSRYYESLNRFAKFVKKVDLPTPQTFIKLMVQRDYPPTMWLIDEVYTEYMEHLYYKIPPQQHAEITTETLLKIADAADCDVSEVFDILNPSEMIEFVKQRKLSPWILLNSSKFFKFLVETKKENVEQYIILESLIRPKYWAKRFEKRPDIVEFMKKIVAGLEL